MDILSPILTYLIFHKLINFVLVNFSELITSWCELKITCVKCCESLMSVQYSNKTFFYLCFSLTLASLEKVWWIKSNEVPHSSKLHDELVESYTNTINIRHDKLPIITFKTISILIRICISGGSTFKRSLYLSLFIALKKTRHIHSFITQNMGINVDLDVHFNEITNAMCRS